MSDLIPETIGKYTIRRMLGEGAMGKVYEGFDESIERRVAIKVLHSHLVNNKNGQEFLDRFKTEAKSAARCTNPNIVMVLEYGEDEGMPFIAMEYVDGYSLDDLLRRNKKISLKNILSIISQILKAIHAAHKLCVIHRDIKTANIIITRGDKTVKLADFGIARLNDTNSMTMTGAVVGTPRYMAPEQMFGLKVDERADLFSVAMVFVEMLSALPTTTDYRSSRLPVIKGLPQNNKINYSIPYPDALIPVLQKGLEVKAANRFQSAREFALAIKQAIPLLKAAEKPRDNITRIAVRPSATTAFSAEDIGLVSRLLTNYIGPVANNLLKDLRSQHTLLGDLVSAASMEIPDEQQRKSFIDDWESSSGGSSLSQEGSLSSSDVSSLSTKGSKIRVDDNTIQKIAHDYVNYIGPFAARLVDYYCQESHDKEEFIKNLANEIPDQQSRDEFTKRWSVV
jgi:serine/threonine-protein kinase